MSDDGSSGGELRAIVRDLVDGNADQRDAAGAKLALLIVRCLCLLRHPTRHPDHNDLLDQTWVNLVKSWRGNPKAAFAIDDVKAYVCRATRNAIEDLRRDRMRNPTLSSEDDESESEASPSQFPMDPETWFTLSKLVNEASDECKALLNARFAGDRTLAEAAELARLPLATFKRRLKACIDELRRKLGKNQ